MYNQIVSAREVYAPVLADYHYPPNSPNTLGMIYNLAVSIAIAEGELTVSGSEQQAAISIAVQALAQARDLASQLKGQFQFLNPDSLNTTDYKNVSNLRQSYQTKFREEGGGVGSQSSALKSNQQAGWSSLGGKFQLTTPAVEAWGPNRLDLFAIGQDKAIYHKAWDGKQWGPSVDGWDSLGGSFQLVAPSAVAWGPNRLDLFAIGQDKAIYHKAWTGNKWSPSVDGWDYRGGEFQIVAPSAVTWNTNRLDIFGIGQDQAIWHQAWDGTQWI